MPREVKAGAVLGCHQQSSPVVYRQGGSGGARPNAAVKEKEQTAGEKAPTKSHATFQFTNLLSLLQNQEFISESSGVRGRL